MLIIRHWQEIILQECTLVFTVTLIANMLHICTTLGVVLVLAVMTFVMTLGLIRLVVLQSEKFKCIY